MLRNILISLFSVVRYVARILPTSITLPTCRFIGALISYFFSKDLKIAVAQIQLAAKKRPELLGNSPPAVERPNHSLEVGFRASAAQKLARNVFAHLGEAVGEVFLLDRFFLNPPHPSLTVTCEGQEIVDELIAHNQGAVTLSGHIGCFELLAAHHAHRGAKVCVIGRASNYSVLQDIIQPLRTNYGVETIWRDDPKSLRVLRNAFKTGRIVAALIDQDTALENIFAEFFGVEAASPAGPIQLAVRQNLPILSSFIVRVNHGKHHVITERIEYSAEDPDCLRHILSVFNQRLENLICRYPEQWLWWHRRWRRRPGVDYSLPESLRSTTRYLDWILEDCKE